ncbi:hypothetical protein [uncultured Sneathia sp.]|uniref:hypothetical protein n=1 Tax=uncultured Sneathia sp. TaxID=278067 RepID=UPI0025967663|nr:hypothetical protein [uncultured Sneathia sp.]
MLILKKLNITDDKPLSICFSGRLKKETLVNGKYVYEFYDRDEDWGMYSPLDKMTYKVTDKKKIKEILYYFFEKCDQGMSPQSLWETVDGDIYESLLKDYEIENAKDFDNVCDELFKYLNKKCEIDKKYIANIEVAYPITWLVEYEIKEDSNV